MLEPLPGDLAQPAILKDTEPIMHAETEGLDLKTNQTPAFLCSLLW